MLFFMSHDNYFSTGGDNSAISRALFDLNRDDYEGIRKTFDEMIWWNNQAKKDFQLAMDEAQQEREFCANDNVSIVTYNCIKIK